MFCIFIVMLSLTLSLHDKCSDLYMWSHSRAIYFETAIM